MGQFERHLFTPIKDFVKNRPIPRIALSVLADELLHGRKNKCGNDRLIFIHDQPLCDRRLLQICRKRWLACRKFIQNQFKGENTALRVALVIVAFTTEIMHVDGISKLIDVETVGCGDAQLIGRTVVPEIVSPDILIQIEWNVLGIQIAMNDSLRVEISQRKTMPTIIPPLPPRFPTDISQPLLQTEDGSPVIRFKHF